MFDHVTIRAADRAASEAFYDVVLPVIGLERNYGGEALAEWGDYSVVGDGNNIELADHGR